jgi:hypothetical protein
MAFEFIEKSALRIEGGGIGLGSGAEEIAYRKRHFVTLFENLIFPSDNPIIAGWLHNRSEFQVGHDAKYAL